MRIYFVRKFFLSSRSPPKTILESDRLIDWIDYGAPRDTEVNVSDTWRVKLK